MIQRIQTIYLILAGVAFCVGAFMEMSIVWTVIFFVLAGLSLGNVFLYKQRPTQAFLCVLPMIVSIVYYIMLAVNQSLMEWYMALPLVAVFFLFLSRKAIVKDEKLVRSLDRIR